ncbi:GspH/FimT family pseudopilin [Dyella japonica]|uniref:GspH/FimT family pseudopilin n=1 Tax=Dyella japonica TaxID=231455 RepID=UPI0002F67BE9|nr:GspH/FimT family pseudopilin [Dyella japonica]
MITLLIGAVIIAFAAPSFRSMVISNRLTTVANEVVDAINVARMEAVKRNGNVQFCSDSATVNTTGNALGDKCGVQGGAVYALSVDNSGNPQLDPVRTDIHELASSLTITGNIVALRFNGQGLGVKPGTSMPYSGTVIDICSPNLNADNHRIVRMVAGSILEVVPNPGSCT